MLLELNIQNYTLIDSLGIVFDRGLNVLTGETGAGKSIIVDALGYLLGDKTDVSVVRKGADRCKIDGVFDIQKNRPARLFLESLSLLPENEEDCLILRREIDAHGKSKSFVNDRAVNLSTLSSLGELLVDIHGQNQHQKLLKTGEQRDFLDRAAGNDSLREEVSRLYLDWKRGLNEKELSQISEQEKNQKIDLYQYQVREIDQARLIPDEEDHLEKMLPQLKNSEKIRETLEALRFELYDREGSAIEKVQESRKKLESLIGLGMDSNEALRLAEESLVRLNEVGNIAERLSQGIVSDPGKLDEAISRQDLISRLKKKYGVSIPRILELRDKVAQDLRKLENHSESLGALEAEIKQSLDRLMKRCRNLSESRNKTAEKLSLALEKEWKNLGFNGARFKVAFVSEKDREHRPVPSSSGCEHVEFLFSANPGQDLKPLKSVASGGELSRIMLALKEKLIQEDPVPTLIFDEVDSGIGGSMGHVVGEKLKKLSRSHQVFAVTHLPQIAAFAGRHIAVRKSVTSKKTQATVELLQKERRIKEIARMLGGISGQDDQPTATSLKHAAELLDHAR